MITEQERAYMEGAHNLWRFHRVDWITLGSWIGLFVMPALFVWAVLHVVGGHPPQPTFHPCGSVQACQQWIVNHPLHPHVTGPTIPSFTYQLPTGNS